MTDSEALALAVRLLNPPPERHEQAHDEATRWADDGRSHE